MADFKCGLEAKTSSVAEAAARPRCRRSLTGHFKPIAVCVS